MSDRCTGHCCERFTLPYKPQELQAAYAEARRRARGETPDLEIRIPEDIEIIAPMVIHLGTHYFSPSSRQPAGRNLEHYTCKHFDRATRSCGIYATRPDVCRDYPHGNACDYPGCTWDAARQGVAPRSRARLPVLPPEQLTTEAPR